MSNNNEDKKNTVEVHVFLILILFLTLVALLGASIYLRNEVNNIEYCVSNVSEEVVEPVVELNETVEEVEVINETEIEKEVLNDSIVIKLNETLSNVTINETNVNVSIE